MIYAIVTLAVVQMASMFCIGVLQGHVDAQSEMIREMLEAFKVQRRCNDAVDRELNKLNQLR